MLKIIRGCLLSTLAVSLGVTAVAGKPQQLRNCKPMNVVTLKDINMAQKKWGSAIVAIGRSYIAKKNYKQVAKNAINDLYAYNFEKGMVLFKPTKAVEKPFRPTVKSALSYFVAGGNRKHAEDKGFALMPWTKVTFKNDAIYFHGDTAIAMGHYTFTPAKGKPVTVEYTLGYVENKPGQLKIFLQHSSLPFSG